MKSTYQSTAHNANVIIGWSCLIVEFEVLLACCLSWFDTWAWCLYPIYGFIGWLPVGALWEFLAKMTDNTSK